MFDILELVFTNYARIDDTVILKNRKEFEEAPDLLLLLQILFQKTGRLPEVGSRWRSPDQ